MEEQNIEGLVPLPVLHGSSRRGPLAGADAALLVLLVHCWCRVMGRRVASWVVRHKKAHCLTGADKPRQQSGGLKSMCFFL